MRIRPERVAEQMKREIAGILAHELNDPRLSSMVSVTEVEVAHDLSFARVYVSVLAAEAEREREIATLQRAAGFVRRQLAPRLGLREVPALRFLTVPAEELRSAAERLAGRLAAVPAEAGAAKIIIADKAIMDFLIAISRLPGTGPAARAPIPIIDRLRGNLQSKK